MTAISKKPSASASEPSTIKPSGSTERLRLFSCHKIVSTLDFTNSDLVEGFLPRSGISTIYGESGSGKSFLALDVGMSIARGFPWHGRTCEEGLVVYIACEGQEGMKKRIAGYLQHHKIRQNTPFCLLPCSVDLLNPKADVNPLIEQINACAEEFKTPVVWIVIDTLWRAMVGGDENSSRDMSAVISNIGLLAEACSAHVSLIHHCGKNGHRGMRGHSSLHAAMDTVIEVQKKQNRILATVVKQKDGAEGIKMSFHLKEIPVRDRYGNLEKSCILETTLMTDREGTLSKAPQVALRVLKECIAKKIPNSKEAQSFADKAGCILLQEWQQCCDDENISNSDKPDSKKRAFKRAVEALQKANRIRVIGDYVCMVNA